MYRLETDVFQLELEPEVFEDDIKYPENTILHINVNSYGFSAKATMDIDVKELAAFAKELLELYHSLSGKARLEEPYGKCNYIEFEAMSGGHIKVKGKIHDGRGGYSQELSFENEFDQTCLRGFVKELYAGYSRYLVDR